MRSSNAPCYSGAVAEFAPPKDLAVAAAGGDPAALDAYLALQYVPRSGFRAG